MVMHGAWNDGGAGQSGTVASCLCAAACLCAVLGVGTETAAGQDRAPSPEPVVSVAKTVPASVGIFAEFNNLGADLTAAPARNAYHLYELLIGSADVRAGSAPDWRRMLLSSVGLRPGLAARELLSHPLAIAAPSWKRLAEGIIIVRLRAHDTLVKNVFPPDGAGFIDRHGDVRVYRTKRVLSAVTNDRILILGQRRHRGSVYAESVKLLLGRGGASLAADPVFRKLLGTLPPGRDGMIYVAKGKDGPLNILSTHLENAVVGFYVDSADVKLAVRATRSKPSGRGRRGTVVSDRLKQLPRTTVAAWCTTLDVRSAFHALIDKGIQRDSPAYYRFLAEALDVGDIDDHLFTKLGPGATIAWDQHLGSGPEVPQLAILLESQDAELCARTAADAMQVVVEWFDLSRRRRPGPRLKFNRSEYLGTTIYELALPLGVGSGATGPARAVSFDPAFAAIDGAFVIAAGSDYIRNLIDAQLGLVPRLSELPDIATMDGGSARAISLAVAQPSLAAQVVEDWLKNPQGLMASWFNEVLGQERQSADRRAGPPKLGIGMRAGHKPGTVSVVRVYPRGRSHGRLLPGDRIIGVDGNLLSLTDATADLRRRIKSPGPDGQWTFRVERQGKILDVPVPALTARKVSQSVTDPAGALRQLQRLFYMIDFADVRVTETSPSTLSARLKLRFSDRGEPPDKH